MARAAVRSLQWSVAIAFLLGAESLSAVAGQAPPDIGGILGTILNSALTEQARREWELRPIADYNCLEAHNMSADRLGAEGIGRDVDLFIGNGYAHGHAEHTLDLVRSSPALAALMRRRYG